MSTQSAPLIRAGALEGLRDLLCLLGADPDKILAQAGISAELLETPDNLISLPVYSRLLNLSAEQTATPWFGLLLSQRQSLDNVGAVGYLARHAPTLRSALTEINQFLRLHDSGTYLDVEPDGDIVVISLNFATVAGVNSQQRCDLAAGVLLKFLRSVLGEQWSPTAAHFEREKPADTHFFERLFRCPLYFGQPVTGFELPTTMLDRQPKGADPMLFRILRDYVERLNQQSGPAVVDQLRHVIREQLEHGPPRLDNAAAALGISRHVLQRRLAAAETSFQKEQQIVRYEVAQRYLAESDLSLIEISGYLSFSEPAVFTRTFQKMSGMSPSEWRQRERPGSRKDKAATNRLAAAPLRAVTERR